MTLAEWKWFQTQEAALVALFEVTPVHNVYKSLMGLFDLVTQRIHFRIFCFFGINESVWSRIKNSILDSPKETHPKSDNRNDQNSAMRMPYQRLISVFESF